MRLLFGALILTSGFIIDAYNILVLYPSLEWGLRFPMFALIDALLKKGHHVTLVGPHKFPGQEANFTFVDLSYNYFHVQDGHTPDVTYTFLQQYVPKWELLNLMPFRCKNIQKLLASNRFKRFREKIQRQNIMFDTVIVDGNTCMVYPIIMAELVVGSKPVIAFLTIGSLWGIHDPLGSFRHLSFSPSLLNPYTDRMNIWQKIENWALDTYFTIFTVSIFRAQAIEYFRPELGQRVTVAIDEYVKRIQLMLIASNSLYNYPRLYGPNVKEVGPLHILKKPQNLSETVKNFLDGAKEGVIYISMGNLILAKSFCEEVIENFLRVFAELSSDYRVLWKWESDEQIPGQPDHILPQKWVQQQSVLAHPKVKVFITHGGLQSFQEAVHYGVPMIGIPWLGEQFANVQKIVDLGIGIRLDFQSLILYENINDTIKSFLAPNNYATYAKNIKEYSEKAKDLTAQSADQAVFWVEYISKIGDASHLRPSTADATIFEYFCLDILTVIVIIAGIVIFGVRALMGRVILL